MDKQKYGEKKQTNDPYYNDNNNNNNNGKTVQTKHKMSTPKEVTDVEDAKREGNE